MPEHDGSGLTKSWTGLKVLVLSPTPTYPLDYGNRRRIYHVCRRLKERGAEIHFVHYPTEEEWGRSVPLDHQRQMMDDWDAYYVAPVTRPLYQPPQGADHTIDEWWDPGIGQVLEWLFRVQSFDVFLINYGWLSKAFELAPPGVFKILDTHDKFSGRRAMLEQNGLVAEYFFTTEEEERIALDRADLVWAIKPDEETSLRLLCDRPVLTMLHAEPLASRWPRARPQVLRFGMTGGNNNINLINFRRFLSVAAQFLRKTLLPCEIVIAGSCCDLLADQRYPFIRQLGRLKSMDEFYDQVDVVLGPMEFSTGLKVRIGEAMSLGKAVVAHAHCFEGYVPSHRFHTLPSFDAMMRAMRDIVRTPALIDTLEAASVESITRAQRSVDRAVAASLPPRRAVPRGFVFTVDLAEIREGSLLFDHVCEAALFVGHQCSVLFFLDGEGGLGDRQALERLYSYGRVVVSPRAAKRLGAALHGLGAFGVFSFEELLQARQLGFWITGPIASLPVRITPVEAPALVSLAALALTLDDPAQRRLLSSLQSIFAKLLVLDLTRTRRIAALGGKNVETPLVPLLWRGFASETLRVLREAPRETVTILIAAPSGPVFDLALEIASRSTSRPIEIVYDDRGLAARGRHDDAAPHGAAPALIGLTDFPQHLWRRRVLPAIVLQIGDADAFGGITEWLDRAAVPRATLFSSDAPRPVVSGRSARRVTGFMESALALNHILGDERAFQQLLDRTARYADTAGDSGWAIIWDRVREIAEQEVQASERAKAETEGPLAGGQPVKAEIVLHMQHDGDRRYVTNGWIGGPGNNIAAFGIRVLETLLPSDIEYKAFGPDGRETPWVSEGKLCGTRDDSVPLTGFAVRLAAHLRDRFDVVYEGSFAGCGPTEPKQNGDACLPAVADNPLEALSIRVVERLAALP